MIKIVVAIMLFWGHVLSGHSAKPATWPTDRWTRSTPAEQQLDSRPLNDLVDLMREGNVYRDLHSLLIVRNGYLVLEEYFGGYHADSLHTLQSVSKSFASALMGIAIEQGKIRDVEEKILDFFPNIRDIQNLDDRKRLIRLKDLLTMRSGTDYREGYDGSPHDRLNHLDGGWDRFYLNRPMVSRPGSRFQYDSGGVILMSAILKNRAGMHADGFADLSLFPPLGISKRDWFKNEEGHPHTGGGLDLLPRDMAKFGLLYLRGGKWEDQQVVPAWWVEESFKKHVSFSDRRSGHDIGYGYLWWILEPDPDGSGKVNIFAAKGFMGQYIFVIPEHDMVVVVTGGARSGSDMRRPVDFLYSHILPSVQR
jgi:CubicO group peptidase (beta-lactamase class C family)